MMLSCSFIARYTRKGYLEPIASAIQYIELIISKMQKGAIRLLFSLWYYLRFFLSASFCFFSCSFSTSLIKLFLPNSRVMMHLFKSNPRAGQYSLP